MKLRDALVTLAVCLTVVVQDSAAQTVWNVNVGNTVNTTHQITTTDNYVGAATENTANSVWNGIADSATATLADSTGSTGAGVTFTITPAVGSGITFNNNTGTVGDEIFLSWIKDGGPNGGNNDPYEVTFGGLAPAPGETYSLVVYSGWVFGPDNVPISQTAGSGLTGTFNLNSLDMEVGNPLATGLAPDTDAANIAGDFNHVRFDGLTPDGSGNLTFSFGGPSGVDAPINGFQLVQLPPDPASGQVWNVNIGDSIDESDDFVGAAPENIGNSSWNSVTQANYTDLPLADSTGSTAWGVTMDLIGAITYGNFAPLTGTGDEIFDVWVKSPDNATPYSLVLGNLDPVATYDLVVYSEWFWKNGQALPVAQTAGTGLGGTIYVNRDVSGVLTNGNVGPLLEDTDPADVDIGATNWFRIKGLTPDANGDLAFSMGGANSPFSGFQLIRMPAPSSVVLVDFTYNPATGTAEVSIEGIPNTPYKLVEADDLDFSNPDQNPIPLSGASVGTQVGNTVTTDGSGSATVQFNLGTTKDATFLRAESVPSAP
ncbi:hypothetical protein [Haloferula sp. A504]|uniref:hypothetical protein n=1 Tax=Haloferula sp. A504 TaxID=3373601 RepID=UPI0031BC6849|nr:hypothetical protein [Verrucomicrobiaceae bacterium E54]